MGLRTPYPVGETKAGDAVGVLGEVAGGVVTPGGGQVLRGLLRGQRPLLQQVQLYLGRGGRGRVGGSGEQGVRVGRPGVVRGVRGVGRRP